MTVKIELPPEIEVVLREQWKDLPRGVLEAVAIEGYREGALSNKEVGVLLGLESRWDVEKFLADRRVERYTAEMVEQDMETFAKLDSIRAPG
jgi:predicted HTH domain antitoxin